MSNDEPRRSVSICIMPIRSLLAETSFDPEQTEMIAKAFDDAWAQVQIDEAEPAMASRVEPRSPNGLSKWHIVLASWPVRSMASVTRRTIRSSTFGQTPREGREIGRKPVSVAFEPSPGVGVAQPKSLLRKHGCDLEITLNLLDETSPPPSNWFNKKRMRRWCLAGFPAVQI